MKHAKPVRNGTLLAVWAALLLGCQTVQIDTPCPRSRYWVPNEMAAMPGYAQILRDAFEIDDQGRPHRYPVLFERLDELERYCWAMRARD